MQILEKEEEFPWMKIVTEQFSKTFPNDYDIDALDFLHECIEKELQLLLDSRNKRAEALFSTLSYFYNHFCWKINWKIGSSNMKCACIKLLSSFIRTGLILNCSTSSSVWIDRILAAIRMFPGDHESVYTALLLISNLKKKYLSAYAAILNHILYKEARDSIEEPVEYMKVILLIRRLKMLKYKSEKSDIISLAARIRPPSSIVTWLLSLNVENMSEIKYRLISKQLISRKFPDILFKKLREIVLGNMYQEKTIKMKMNHESSPDNSFIIDKYGQSSNKCCKMKGRKKKTFGVCNESSEENTKCHLDPESEFSEKFNIKTKPFCRNADKKQLSQKSKKFKNLKSNHGSLHSQSPNSCYKETEKSMVHSIESTLSTEKQTNIDEVTNKTSRNDPTSIVQTKKKDLDHMEQKPKSRRKQKNSLKLGDLPVESQSCSMEKFSLNSTVNSENTCNDKDVDKDIRKDTISNRKSKRKLRRKLNKMKKNLKLGMLENKHSPILDDEMKNVENIKNDFIIEDARNKKKLPLKLKKKSDTELHDSQFTVKSIEIEKNKSLRTAFCISASSVASTEIFAIDKQPSETLETVTIKKNKSNKRKSKLNKIKKNFKSDMLEDKHSPILDAEMKNVESMKKDFIIEDARNKRKSPLKLKKKSDTELHDSQFTVKNLEIEKNKSLDTGSPVASIEIFAVDKQPKETLETVTIKKNKSTKRKSKQKKELNKKQKLNIMFPELEYISVSQHTDTSTSCALEAKLNGNSFSVASDEALAYNKHHEASNLHEKIHKKIVEKDNVECSVFNKHKKETSSENKNDVIYGVQGNEKEEGVMEKLESGIILAVNNSDDNVREDCNEVYSFSQQKENYFLSEKSQVLEETSNKLYNEESENNEIDGNIMISDSSKECLENVTNICLKKGKSSIVVCSDLSPTVRRSNRLASKRKLCDEDTDDIAFSELNDLEDSANFASLGSNDENSADIVAEVSQNDHTLPALAIQNINKNVPESSANQGGLTNVFISSDVAKGFKLEKGFDHLKSETVSNKSHTNDEESNYKPKQHKLENSCNLDVNCLAVCNGIGKKICSAENKIVKVKNEEKISLVKHSNHLASSSTTCPRNGDTFIKNITVAESLNLENEEQSSYSTLSCSISSESQIRILSYGSLLNNSDEGDNCISKDQIENDNLCFSALSSPLGVTSDNEESGNNKINGYIMLSDSSKETFKNQTDIHFKKVNSLNSSILPSPCLSHSLRRSARLPSKNKTNDKDVVSSVLNDLKDSVEYTSLGSSINSDNIDTDRSKDLSNVCAKEKCCMKAVGTEKNNISSLSGKHLKVVLDPLPFERLTEHSPGCEKCTKLSRVDEITLQNNKSAINSAFSDSKCLPSESNKEKFLSFFDISLRNRTEKGSKNFFGNLETKTIFSSYRKKSPEICNDSTDLLLEAEDASSNRVVAERSSESVSDNLVEKDDIFITSHSVCKDLKSNTEFFRLHEIQSTRIAEVDPTASLKSSRINQNSGQFSEENIESCDKNFRRNPNLVVNMGKKCDDKSQERSSIHCDLEATVNLNNPNIISSESSDAENLTKSSFCDSSKNKTEVREIISKKSNVKYTSEAIEHDQLELGNNCNEIDKDNNSNENKTPCQSPSSGSKLIHDISGSSVKNDLFRQISRRYALRSSSKKPNKDTSLGIDFSQLCINSLISKKCSNSCNSSKKNIFKVGVSEVLSDSNSEQDNDCVITFVKQNQTESGGCTVQDAISNVDKDLSASAIKSKKNKPSDNIGTDRGTCSSASYNLRSRKSLIAPAVLNL